MSNSTTNLDQITSSASQREVTTNALFDAASPATVFGRRASTTSGLTWGYYGGVMLVSDVPTAIANGTKTLTDDDTNYIYVTAAGTVTQTVTPPAGWPGPLAAGAVALYEIDTAAGLVTGYTDYRLAGGTAGATGAAGADGENWSVTVNAQTGTTYTLQASDNGVVVTLSNASPITLTVPSGLGANFACEIIQIGAGQVTVAQSGTTVNSYGGLLSLAGQHACATLVAYVANTFNLTGNLA